MHVISHCGYWQKNDEKNHAIAFRRSFDCGFGVETDIRDSNGQLVISHDIPTGSDMMLADFLELLDSRKLILALNIKANGLALQLKKTMESAGSADWFVFDMSVPDMQLYLQANIPVFTRMSEVEKEPVWFKQATGVWLDGFSEDWYDSDVLRALLQSGKRVCVVSPELHGREYTSLWKTLLSFSGHPSLILCTDYPKKAKNFFGE